MTDHHSARTRRTVLRGGLGAGLGALALTGLESVRGLADQAMAGVPTAATRAFRASTGCATLTKEETQGPFWVDERLERSDIRADSVTGAKQSGVPLTLTITLQDAGASCAPQVGAYVDVWHANAAGAYSDVSGSGNPNNVGVDWLRGYQVSDENGQVTFTTVMPGRYVGRTVHLHFRVRVALSDSSTVNFTSQIFIDQGIQSAYLATSAYSGSKGTTTNAADGLYDASLLATVTGDTSGYAAAFTVSLDFGDGTDDGDGSGTDGGTTDATVGASVRFARVVRVGARREVQVRLKRSERVAALVRLARHDEVLAAKRTGWLRAGSSVIRLKVPAGVGSGSAKVLVTIVDRHENAKLVRRVVRVPARRT